MRDIVGRVEDLAIEPVRIAERFNLDVADVYEALAFYRNNPQEMREVERRHEQAVETARRRSQVTPPSDGE